MRFDKLKPIVFPFIKKKKIQSKSTQKHSVFFFFHSLLLQNLWKQTLHSRKPVWEALLNNHSTSLQGHASALRSSAVLTILLLLLFGLCNILSCTQWFLPVPPIYLVRLLETCWSGWRLISYPPAQPHTHFDLLHLRCGWGQMLLWQQCSSLALAGDLEIPIPPVRAKEAGEPMVSQAVCISQPNLLASVSFFLPL